MPCAKLFEISNHKENVDSLFKKASSQVTEGGQRTMRTHLAAASGLTSVAQLPSSWMDGCKILHLEGYVLYRPKLAKEAVRLARKHGSLVSTSAM